IVSALNPSPFPSSPTHRPPSSTPSPYTTLFRSLPVRLPAGHHPGLAGPGLGRRAGLRPPARAGVRGAGGGKRSGDPRRRLRGGRSEEHTELQSRENLVCRLLLEKKKHKKTSETR